ncbi:MAG: hypothetical protein NC310_07845 [Roseburia sp.]|nr:hypothetical protein [Anaeroplasma bactoclasticum]MCM1196959.1 hypothetical protein [Roseburia sp.]
MENLFQIYYDKKTHQTFAEYDNFVIRKVTKKQEEKLMSLGQKYKIEAQNGSMPRWLNLMNHLSFCSVFTSFIFLITALLLYIKENNYNFITKYLWLIIIFSLSIAIFLLSILFKNLDKKRKKRIKAEEASQALFNEILEMSKKFLSVPASAKNLEVLMEQHKEKQKPTMKKYSNVLLSVFLENDMLCFADLYLVVGIPLKRIDGIDKVMENYRFEYWHKGKEVDFESLGVTIDTKYHSYQANQYAILKMNHLNKALGIFIPNYEINQYELILKEKRDKE